MFTILLNAFTKNRAAPRAAALLLLFGLSGATGLVYELCWTRVASTWFGVSAYAISTILATFFGGLAAGAALGARAMRRWPGGRPLRRYALAEAGVAVAAMLVLGLMQFADVAMIGVSRAFPGFSPLSLLVRFAALTPLLLLPTMLMGASFPLFIAALEDRTGPRRGLLGLAYGANVAGAALGCAGTAFVLLAGLGVSRSVLLAACVNLLVAACAFGLDRSFKADPVAAAPDAPSETPDQRRTGSRPTAALVALSGGLAMALEVLWARMFPVPLGLLNAFRGFTVVLSLVLGGMAMGSLGLAAVEARGRPLLKSQRLLGFAALQCAIGLLSLLGLAHVQAVLRHWLGLGMGVQQLLIGALVILPALLLGASFPLLSAQDVAEDDDGARLGRLYAISTLAGVAGSTLAGFVLIPALGLRLSVITLVGLGALVAVLAVRAAAPRARWWWLPALPAAAALFAAFGTIDWPNFEPTGPVRYLADGLEATTVVVGEAPPSKRNRLFSNGIPIEGVASLERTVVPVAMVESPRHVLLIGFGTGLSAQSLLSEFPQTRVDCVELDDNQRQTTGFFGTTALLTDPRFALYIEDGRQFLLRTQRHYDAIVVDTWGQTLNQEFYNKDFFAVAERALTPDGLFFIKLPVAELTSTADLDVVLASAQAGFSYAYAIPDPRIFPGIVGRRAPLVQTQTPPGLPKKVAASLAIAWESVKPVDAAVVARLGDSRVNSDDRPYFFRVGPGKAQQMDAWLAKVLR